MPELGRALGAESQELWKSRDLLVLLDSEQDVLELKPIFSRLEEIEAFGIVVTAPGTDCDFVSRYFAPREGIPEDPVTGSAHCTLVPFWASRLQKTSFLARQVSRRGGILKCELAGDRVFLSGQAVKVMEGSILLD